MLVAMATQRRGTSRGGGLGQAARATQGLNG